MVFKAKQIDSNRLIALKILHRQNEINEESKKRFIREALALQKLCHENVVTVYHMGLSDDSVPFLAMELINGLSLRKLLSDNGGFSVFKVLEMMEQLCDAVSAIHEAGIIHRDLKPENIMLSKNGDADLVKIVDFGLAKTSVEAGDQNLTATGLLIGTVNYMSPEQIQGGAVDARSDIYSLTVCMFELLAGEPPFIADNPMGVMYKHLNEKTPNLKLNSQQESVDPHLDAFIKKGLEKQPSLRFQSAAEMHNELRYLGDRMRLSKRRSSVKFLMPTACILGVALLIGILSTAMKTFHYGVKNHPLTPIVKGAESKSDSYEHAYLKLIAKSEKSFGPSHPKTLEALESLAELYGRQMKLEAAEPLLRRALQIKENRATPSNYDVAECMEKLSRNLLSQRKFIDANNLANKSLELTKKASGADSMAFAWKLNSLGELQIAMNNELEAESSLKRSLTIAEKLLDKRDPQLAPILNNLGCVYRNQQNYNEAEKYFKRSLKVREEGLESNDIAIGWSLQALASFYKAQGKRELAEPLFMRAVKIYESIGPERLDLGACIQDLGDMYVESGRHREGEAKLKESLKIFEKMNPGSIEEATCRKRIAHLFILEENKDEAKRYLESALKIFESKFGKNDGECQHIKTELIKIDKKKTGQTSYESVGKLESLGAPASSRH